MQNLTVPIFEKLFEEELALLKNPICRACNVEPDLKHPLLPWIVGGNFKLTDERILFVGKPHRGTFLAKFA